MKRVYIAAALIILLMTFTFFVLWYLSDCGDQLIGKIDQTVASIEIDDWKAAELYMEDLKLSWEKANQLWKRFVRHSELDQISGSIARAKPFLYHRQTGDALAELYNARMLILEVYKSEIPSFQNVL